MHFSARVRNELARALPARRCCQRAELAALADFSGEIVEGGMRIAVSDAAVARKLFSLAKQVQGEAPVIEPRPGRRGRIKVHLSAPPPTGASVYERDCCGRAYLRGAWLSRGSISDPEAGYHLEMVAPRPELARRLLKLLERYDIGAGRTLRKGDELLYIKGADAIAEFLGLTEAHGALLKLEDFRVLKEMRGRINRLVNAETSNVEKVVTAALKQIEDIRLIDERIGVHRLPPALRELAAARLAHPDASLRDLGQRFDPPLSKSAVNHRMRRLADIAESLRRNRSAPSGNKG